MRNINYFAATFFVMLGMNAAIAGDTALKSTFEARYAAMKAAMASRDGKAISALLAADFISVDTSGQTENGAQMTSEVGALPVDPHKVSQTTILSVKVNGNAATIDQRYDMKTTKTGPDGIPKNVELITLSTDTWTKAGGIWLLERTATKQIDYFVNGQPIMHKTATP